MFDKPTLVEYTGAAFLLQSCGISCIIYKLLWQRKT